MICVIQVTSDIRCTICFNALRSSIFCHWSPSERCPWEHGVTQFIHVFLYSSICSSISFPSVVHSFHFIDLFYKVINSFQYIVFILIHLVALVGCPPYHWRVQRNHETQGMERSWLCWSASTCQVGRFELCRMGSHQL